MQVSMDPQVAWCCDSCKCLVLFIHRTMSSTIFNPCFCQHGEKGGESASGILLYPSCLS